MSTKDIRRVLNWMQHNRPEGTSQVVAAALAEVEAIEKAAAALVDWNNHGRPAFHLDAARGYDVLERIAKDSAGVK